MSVYSRFSSTPPQVAHHGIKHSRNVRRTHPSERSAARNSYTASQEWRQANPEFDEIQLDENYYQSLGLSAEELADQLGFSASDADPLGQDFGPEGPADGQLDAGSFLMDEDRNEATWGPQAMLLAGFKAEESAIIRCILDTAGSAAVKVIPCTSDMLYLSVQHGLNEPEVDWSQPRPDSWGRGREWGSQRVILFSGLSGGTVLAIVDLLEEAGLPPLCIAVAEEVDGDRVVGEVLAEAIKAQRGRKNPQKHVWDVPGHVSRHLPDLEELIGAQARQRSQALQKHKQRQQQQAAQGPSRTQAPSHTAVGPLHTEHHASSSVHTPQTDATSSSASTSQLQHPEPLSASPSGSELKTDAVPETVQSRELGRPPSQETVQPTELGGLLPEEQRALQHAQAMTPGIDALRKRRTQPAEHQHHTPPQDHASLLKQQRRQEITYQIAERPDAAASSSVITSSRNPQSLTSADSATIQPEQQAPVAGSETSDDLEQLNHKLKHGAPDALTTANSNNGPVENANTQSKSAEQPQQSQRLLDELNYENLLDAIAEGNLDWERPTQEAAGPSQSPTETTQVQKQQPISFNFRQMQLHSEEAPRKQQLQQQQRRQQQRRQQQQQQQQQQQLQEQQHQEQQQEQQDQLMPKDGSGNANSSSDALLDRVLQQASATPDPDTHASTSRFSQPAVMPGSSQHEGMPDASQHPAGPRADQHADEPDVTQRPGIAQHQASGSEAPRDMADPPRLSQDVVARSSRLRLRRASPGLQAQKQGSKARAGKGAPSNRPFPLSSPRGAPQGTMKETKWRVIKSEQTTAEEFVKRPAGVDRQRPAWATNAAFVPEENAAAASEDNAALASRDRASGEAAQAHMRTDESSSPPVGRALTKQELRALAVRRGLDFEQLLADALARGIPVSD